jgi:hypothetical protein
MRIIRSLTLSIASAAVGLIFGLAISKAPLPNGVGEFWLPNLAAPWIILIFCAGRMQQSAFGAALSGALFGVFAIVGFYAQFLTVENYRPGEYGAKSLFSRIQGNLDSWLHFVAPWILLGLMAGLTYGLIGNWWRKNKSVFSLVLLVLPIIFEPLGWRIYEGHFQKPWILWIMEPVAGIAILFVGWILGRTANETHRARAQPRRSRSQSAR